MLTTRAIDDVLDGLMAIATLSMMLLYSSLLTAVVVATVLLYSLVRTLSRPLRDASFEAVALSAKEQTCLMETIRAIAPIKLFGKEADRGARWTKYALRFVLFLQQRPVRLPQVLFVVGDMFRHSVEDGDVGLHEHHDVRTGEARRQHRESVLELRGS